MTHYKYAYVTPPAEVNVPSGWHITGPNLHGWDQGGYILANSEAEAQRTCVCMDIAYEIGLEHAR